MAGSVTMSEMSSRLTPLFLVQPKVQSVLIEPNTIQLRLLTEITTFSPWSQNQASWDFASRSSKATGAVLFDYSCIQSQPPVHTTLIIHSLPSRSGESHTRRGPFSGEILSRCWFSFGRSCVSAQDVSLRSWPVMSALTARFICMYNPHQYQSTSRKA